MDYPPIRFTRSRKQVIFLIIGGLAFAAVSLFLLFSNPSENLLIGILGFGFFGVLCLPASLYMLAHPQYLLLDENGFEMPMMGKKVFRARWVDVASFEMTSIKGSPMVGITYQPGYERQKIGRSVLQLFSGVEGGISSMYEGTTTEQLYRILESYRVHYGTGGMRNNPPLHQ